MALHAPSAVCAATILPDVPVPAVCVGTTSQSPLSDQLQLMNSDCRRAVQGLFADLVDRCLKDAVNEIRGKENLQCEEDVAMMFLTRGNFPNQWFLQLAESGKDGMLWAGFWNGPGAETARAALDALFNFADLLSASTVHPDTELGRLVNKCGELEACSSDPAAFGETRALEGVVPSFWQFAGIGFVKPGNKLPLSLWLTKTLFQPEARSTLCSGSTSCP